MPYPRTHQVVVEPCSTHGQREPEAKKKQNNHTCKRFSAQTCTEAGGARPQGHEVCCAPRSLNPPPPPTVAPRAARSLKVLRVVAHVPDMRISMCISAVRHSISSKRSCMSSHVQRSYTLRQPHSDGTWNLNHQPCFSRLCQAAKTWTITATCHRKYPVLTNAERNRIRATHLYPPTPPPPPPAHHETVPLLSHIRDKTQSQNPWPANRSRERRHFAAVLCEKLLLNRERLLGKPKNPNLIWD